MMEIGILKHPVVPQQAARTCHLRSGAIDHTHTHNSCNDHQRRPCGVASPTPSTRRDSLWDDKPAKTATSKTDRIGLRQTTLVDLSHVLSRFKCLISVAADIIVLFGWAVQRDTALTRVTATHLTTPTMRKRESVCVCACVRVGGLKKSNQQPTTLSHHCPPPPTHATTTASILSTSPRSDSV